jgi:hypothetical protein
MGRAQSTNGETRNAYTTLVGSPKGTDHWEDTGGRVTLKWICER